MIGQSSDLPLGYKDAYHVPAILVKSDHKVKPGETVRLGLNSIVYPTKNDPDAIVDPFIAEIPLGSKFWILLYPGKTTKVTHHFDIIGMEDDDEFGCKGCW